MTKVKTFELKFIDHASKKKLVVEIDIYSNKIMEWIENDNDEAGYVEWLVQSGKKEMNLKKNIINFVNKTYLTAGDNGKFEEYRLAKIKTKKESEMVNMSNESVGSRRIREVKSEDCKSMKFVKGENPADWRNVLDYTKRHVYHEFFMNGDELADNITFVEVAKFEIPSPEVKLYTENGVSKINKNIVSQTMNKNQSQAAVPANQNVAAKINSAAATNSAAANKAAIIKSLGLNQTAVTNLSANANLNASANANLNVARNLSAQNQAGGNLEDDDYGKYMKYKKKYMELKNQKSNK